QQDRIPAVVRSGAPDAAAIAAVASPARAQTGGSAVCRATRTSIAGEVALERDVRQRRRLVAGVVDQQSAPDPGRTAIASRPGRLEAAVLVLPGVTGRAA